MRRREGVLIFLAAGQATAIEAIAVEAIKIVSIDINIIVVNVRDNEIINIGTNATTVAQTNNLLEVLVLLTLPGVRKCFSRDLVISTLLAFKRECAIF
jgi:hypothetical protein